MNNNLPQNPAELQSDDKMLAMFAHFSIFLGGIILPIIFYFMQKGKSKYVAFHSLQSIFFHLLYMFIVLFIVFVLVIVLVLLGVFNTKYFSHSDSAPAGFIIGMIMFYIGLFGSIIVFIGSGVYMGIKAYNGNWTKYPIVGNWAYNKVYGK